MKKPTLMMALICGALLLNPTNLLARDYIIGLSPFQKPASAKTQVIKVISFLANTLNPGDSCYLFDAFNMSTIGTFTVPNKKAYSHPKAKIGVNKKAVASLLQFAKNAEEPEGKFSVTGAVLLPQALRFISENYAQQKGTPLAILGSPIFDDPKDPGFSMAEGHIPGDGHLQSSPIETPFGISGNEQLANLNVHLGFADMAWKRTERHYTLVKRFWVLFIEKQGGHLVSFTSDLPTLLNKFQDNAKPRQHDYQVEPTDKLEMIFHQPPAVKEQVSIYDRPLSVVPVSLSLAKKASRVEIGISWDCRCDIDLYARPRDAETLYFNHKESKEGRYIKDFMSSPKSSNGFEKIVFDSSVNLENLLLVINLYSGNVSSPVQGELRISFDNKTYAQTFQIDALQGNSGKGRHQTIRLQKPANPNWIVIDPMKVVGLR